MAIDVIAGGLSAGVGQASRLTGGGTATGTAGQAADGFAASLGRLVGATENAGAQANDAVGQMLDGTGDVHDAMIALQRADMTLQLTVQVRNKLVSAYQEIMRMPV
jgi:flagellar hook-basal body complex protein FliE